jgi:RNA polymerase sigma-70 factor (ECF subfamily)
MTAEEFKKEFLSFGKSYYLIAYRMLGSSEEAEDAVQDVYVKLWNMREKLAGVRNPEAFGVSMTRNLCIDRIRSLEHRMSEEGTAESIESKGILEKEVGDDAGRRLDCSEKVKRIRELMGGLPERQRSVFDLRYFRDCELAEIEKIEGLSAVNVRVLLSRARKTITNRLKKEEEL